MSEVKRIVTAAVAASLAVGAPAACSSGSTSSATSSASASGSTSASESANATPSATGTPVPAAELTALLVDRTYSGEYQGAPYSEYYDANGTLRGKDVNGATAGTWKVQGDTVCFTYTTDATPTTDCFNANQDGTNVYWYKDGKFNDATSYVLGNPNNY